MIFQRYALRLHRSPYGNCGLRKTTVLRSRFVETGLSKILVYNENIDDIVGYIHSSEMFKNPEDWTQSIQRLDCSEEL